MARDKTLDILTHLLGIVAGFIPALIIFLVTKDKTTKKHARNALNWQISAMIYGIISAILLLVLVGLILLPILIVLDLVFSIMAAVKASNDELWSYPLAIPFLKN